MELCPHCGNEIPAGAPFCPQCGQALLGTRLQRVCPACRVPVPPEAQFCPECGASLLVASSTPTSTNQVDALFGAMGTNAPPTTPRSLSTTVGTQTATEPQDDLTEEHLGSGPPSYPTFTTYPTSPGEHGQPLAGDWPLTLPPDMPTYTRIGRGGSYAGMPRAARAFVQRYPWLSLGGAAGILLLLAYAIPVLVGGRDWAAGAAVLGVVAAVLAVATFAGLGVWALTPNRPRQDIAVGLGATLLLAALAIGGLAAGPTIHATQATLAARGGHWSEAITEERMLDTPTAKLQVLTIYAEWMGQDPNSVPYPTTITYLESLRSSASCGAACKQSALADEVQARYLYGEHLALAKNEAAAVAQFAEVERLIPTGNYAKLAHTAAAASYYAMAQQRASAHACSAEVAFYQTLAKGYADTPQGKTATQALAAGVTVSGAISGLPDPAATTLYLSQTVHPWYHFSKDYATHPNMDGSFTFKGVKPGKYNLSGVGIFGLTYWHDASPPYNPYTIVVGPICSVSAGTYPY